jgi:hypothetical protein
MVIVTSVLLVRWCEALRAELKPMECYHALAMHEIQTGGSIISRIYVAVSEALVARKFVVVRCSCGS